MQINPLYIPDVNSANTSGNIEQFQFKSLSVIFADMIKIFTAENDKPVTLDKDSHSDQLTSNDLQVSLKENSFDFEPNNYNLYDNIHSLNESVYNKTNTNSIVLNVSKSGFSRLIEDIEFLSFSFTEKDKFNLVEDDSQDIQSYITKPELQKLTECILNFIKQLENDFNDSKNLLIANDLSLSENPMHSEIADKLYETLTNNIQVNIEIENADETLQISLLPVMIEMPDADENYIFFPENHENEIISGAELSKEKPSAIKTETLLNNYKITDAEGSKTLVKSEFPGSGLVEQLIENEAPLKQTQMVFSVKLNHKIGSEQKEAVHSKVLEVVDEKNKNNLIFTNEIKSDYTNNNSIKIDDQYKVDKILTFPHSNRNDQVRAEKMISLDTKTVDNSLQIQSIKGEVKAIPPERIEGYKNDFRANHQNNQDYSIRNFTAEKINESNLSTEIKFGSLNASIKENSFIENEIGLNKKDIQQVSLADTDKLLFNENKQDILTTAVKSNTSIHKEGKVLESSSIRSNIELEESLKVAGKENPGSMKVVSEVYPEEKSVIGELIKSFNKINNNLADESREYKITFKPLLITENKSTNDNGQQFSKHQNESVPSNETTSDEMKNSDSFSKEYLNSDPIVKEVTPEKIDTNIKTETVNSPVIQVLKTNDFNIQKNNVKQMNNLIESLKYLLIEKKSKTEVKDISVKKRTDNEIELRLMPERLGKIKVKLNVLENHLNATLEVENKTVQSIVSSNIEYLKTSLTQQGLHLNSISISLFSSDNRSGKTFSQKKKQFNTETGNTEIDNVPHQLIKSLGYNTYEYIA